VRAGERRPSRRRAGPRPQGGFTLIEIMISLVISSLLVAMILSIFTSMSAAYRSQQQVAELQQILQAAEASVEADIRQAGFRCAQGFTYAGGGTTIQPPLLITDGGTGAQATDQIAVFYGDPSAQARVIVAPATAGTFTSVSIDAPDKFAIGDLVLLSTTNSNPTTSSWTFATQGAGVRPPEEPAIFDTNVGATLVVSYACVLQIAAVNATTITFSTAAPWGSATNAHCFGATGPNQNYSGSNVTMLYRFVARAYRVDPTRKNLSVFQRSPSGGLVANDWQDLGLGFTNFQIASRWYEQYQPPGTAGAATGVDNADGDTDPWRNWYSGTLQNTRSLQSAGYPGASMDPNKWVSALQVSVSFVARTTRPIVDGTVTGATPQLQDPTNVNFNDIGDSPPVTLAGVADASRPVELRGNNIYRYATIKIDTRNLGVGR
jgi:prepilin-type N-terminal cleavage/methylation domain-containing protein